MTRFFISDPHFGHAAILTFLNPDGSRLRPFANLDEMHDHIIMKWNSRVTEADTVYVLGDICFKHRHLDILDQCNGRKILIRGNHDNEKLSRYTKHFADVRGCDVKEGYIATHVPIHPESVKRFGLNIHGHLHGNSLRDPRYFCVSMEQVDYTPITLEEIKQRIEKPTSPQPLYLDTGPKLLTDTNDEFVKHCKLFNENMKGRII